MNKPISKFTDVISSPGFRLMWILLAVAIVAFVLDIIVFTNNFLLLIEGALLLLVVVIAFGSAYQLSQSGRDLAIGQSELSGILANMEDAIIVYQEGFRVIFFNQAAERLFRLSASAVVGHILSPRDIETEGWRPLVQVVFPSLASRVIVHSKDGVVPQVADVSFTDPVMELRVMTGPLKDDGGRTIGFIKIIRNRTTLIEAMRSKSEFVTVASHQLRGPVTDINWALESLSRATELNETDQTIVTTALAAGQGLIRRIEDLLNIARMEEGQFGYAFEDSDISDFIAKTLVEILPAAQKAGIKIYFDRPSAELPHVTIDPKRLSLVLVNLVENAIRYNVQNGEVIIKVDKMPDKPFVLVSVKDTGIGVPPEDMPKLFNKFYRAENAMKLQTEGSGLGLYIAKGIVSAHGGQIWAESEQNRGTTMSFTLPTDPNLVPKHEAGGDYLL